MVPSAKGPLPIQPLPASTAEKVGFKLRAVGPVERLYSGFAGSVRRFFPPSAVFRAFVAFLHPPVPCRGRREGVCEFRGIHSSSDGALSETLGKAAVRPDCSGGSYALCGGRVRRFRSFRPPGFCSPSAFPSRADGVPLLVRGVESYFPPFFLNFLRWSSTPDGIRN